MLTWLTELPAGMLECSAGELHTCLDGPTVIRLEGLRSPPMFISVLQHGNAVSGWEAVRRRPIPVRAREVANMVGLMLLAVLMVMVMKNDITRLLR